MSKEEKINLAVKYQAFVEGTALFTEIELDEKIVSEMKLKILGVYGMCKENKDIKQE